MKNIIIKTTLSKIKQPKNSFLILLLFYIISRVVILLTSNTLFFWEECHRGTLAYEILNGRVFNIFSYRWTDYEGGFIIEAFIIAIFYKLFGVSWIVLKTICLLFSIGIFILVYMITNKFINKRAAIISSILIILSPIYYTTESLITQANYMESIFFSLLLLYIFLDIFFRKNRNNLLKFAIFGFLCGFSFFFSYGTLPMITLLVIFWFILDKLMFLKKEFFIFFIFLLIALSPLIYFNITQNNSGFNIFRDKLIAGEVFTKNRLMIILDNFFFLISKGIIDSFFYPNIIMNGRLFSYLYYLLFIISFGYLITNEIYNFNLKKIGKSIKPLTIILIFIIFYSAIFSFSRFRYPNVYRTDILEYPFVHKYYLILYPFIFISISVFLSFIKNKLIIKIFLLIFVFLTLISFIANLFLVLNFDIGRPKPNYEPFCYEISEIRWWGEGWYNDEKIPSIAKNYYDYCDNIESKEKDYCKQAVTWNLYWLKNFDSLEYYKSCRLNKTNVDSKECFKNFTTIIGWRHSFFPDQDIDIMSGINVCKKFLPEYSKYCFKALGWTLGWKNYNNKIEVLNVCNRMGENKVDCLEGSVEFLRWYESEKSSCYIFKNECFEISKDKFIGLCNILKEYSETCNQTLTQIFGENYV
jgi:hypothetical protein